MEAQQPSHNPKELMDIQSIIQFGIKKPELFQIPFFLNRNQDVKVKIRGLSNYEFDEINIEMYQEIKDTNTINYVFNQENNIVDDEVEDQEESQGAIFNNEEELKNIIIEESKKIEKPKPVIDHTAIVKAFLFRKVLVVWHAMKDFYSDLTINHIKQLEGLNEIYERVKEKSGRAAKSKDSIEFFREEQSESEPQIASK